MVRLILEENGQRRAFRVGAGVLTLGSGPDAKLQLASDGVAALHAELEVVGDHAQLRLLPGVAAPTLDGETVLGEVEVHQGQALVLGTALLWLEDEALEAGSGRPARAAGGTAAQAASQGAAPKVSRPAGKPAAVQGSGQRDASRQRAMRQARERGDRSRVQRTRPRTKPGLPTGAVLGILAAVLLVGGFALRKAFRVSAESTTDAAALIRGATEAVNEALYTKAENKLSIINMDKATSAERATIADLRRQIAEGYEQQDVQQDSSRGHKWFDVYLSNYEKKYLQGSPRPAHIRLFLKRCKEFRSRWPEHERLDWVSRQEQRFRGAVNLSEPPTFADVDWEVQFILGVTPKMYEPALELVDEFLARSGVDDLDREAMQNLRREIEEERVEQFDEALKWAKHEYEVKENEMKAVHWLVFAAAYMEDPAMEDEAAELLLAMPNLKGHLEAYQREKPEVFEDLLENSLVRRKAVELGVL